MTFFKSFVLYLNTNLPSAVVVLIIAYFFKKCMLKTENNNKEDNAIKLVFGLFGKNFKLFQQILTKI